MNKILCLLFSMSFLFVKSQMVLEYNTNLMSGTKIQLAFYNNVDITINWGDSNIENYTGDGVRSHIYASNGTYQVEITGTAERFGGSSLIIQNSLTEVISFGNLGLTSLNNAFQQANNLSKVTEILPNTIIDLNSAFNKIEQTSIIGLDLWDASNVTTMLGTFRNASNFNQDISNWNIGNVENTGQMFYGASSFNQNIGSWNTASVTYMSYMFYGASSFNQNIGGWDVSNVETMHGMFEGASEFNQDIGDWDVSSVKALSSMFNHASSFNQNINNWDVSNVLTFEETFAWAISYNQPLNNWDVSNAVSLEGMFNSASSFNQPLDNWNTNNVITLSKTFDAARIFNQDLSSWDISNVTNLYSIFRAATNFNQDISNWDFSKVEVMISSFLYSSLSDEYYDKLLISWSQQNVRHDVRVDISSKYSIGNPKAAKLSLYFDKDWEIHDDGIQDYCTWTGNTNSDWETASNWNPQQIPNFIDVLIPESDNYPIINTGQGGNCEDLVLEESVNLTIKNGGSLITTGVITNDGSINIEKEISKEAWHYFSSPISSATSNIFLGEYLQKWDESIGEWIEITSTSSILESGKGYGVFIQNGKVNQLYTFTGTPNTGDIDRSISYHDNFDDPVNGHDGANLLGNPYPSSIDWNMISGLGAVYCWNGSGYVAYPETGDYGTGSRYIAPLQGFFIVIPDNAPSSITFNNSMRTHEGATNYYKTPNKNLTNGFVLGTGDENSEDQLLIRQNESSQISFDHDKDALKFFSNIAGKSEVWSMDGNEYLSIDVRPDISEIPLSFKNSNNGTYSIYIKELADINFINIFDKKTNAYHDLISSPYTFNWRSNDSSNRFTIYTNTTGIDNLHDDSLINTYYRNGYVFYNFNKDIVFESIKVFTVSGKLVANQTNKDSRKIKIKSNICHGIYLIEFVNKNTSVTKKIMI